MLKFELCCYEILNNSEQFYLLKAIQLVNQIIFNIFLGQNISKFDKTSNNIFSRINSKYRCTDLSSSQVESTFLHSELSFVVSPNTSADSRCTRFLYKLE